ncbi:MAG TPA: hypothetical protein VG323_10100 [Thermoanaerobaculia bacterium]|nr:hypothetical protein [Thermoanaerobaculia bacterium]
MTHVLEFVEHTASDLRGGRHTWRVLTILWAVSLSAAVLARLILH